MKSSVLKVSHLAKKIKKLQIIHDVSFDIREGEILGFLGPNGSGKTTTLRMIVGLSKPTGGDVTICGHSLKTDYVKAMSNVGCIIEGPDLYGYMSGYKNLELLANMSEGVTKQDIDDAVTLVGMEKRIHDKVDVYSMGMKQRVGLAQALIHKPRLLILDEPTNGLDPQGIHEFREIVKKLARETGISVLVSSHLISEVQLMCDRVSIINKGRIIKNASVEELVSTGQVVWTVDQPLKAQTFLKERFALDTVLEHQTLTALVGVDRLPGINRTLVEEGFKITYVDNKKQTLENLFLSLTDNKSIQ
ncbi:ABC transporter ATP-binding protein [Alkalibacterium pelagium]|uniref:ABC-2 type transport system ATP-binding protein n=1 Tax=Alkalibacterium pelagium TaxID=426702 RepID=A0A1H7LCW0_9LACT|nr:ABC transporter ATP-binding protein [Alkalibacterium pelagium]GEN50935.1 ABC transporter ATP-binding protein [Alkalibacterium pelagium]SEK96157.1 ABC-2 type transport system ATP-binding protein [Alkalibacterium pelagium]